MFKSPAPTRNERLALLAVVNSLGGFTYLLRKASMRSGSQLDETSLSWENVLSSQSSLVRSSLRNPAIELLLDGELDTYDILDIIGWLDYDKEGKWLEVLHYDLSTPTSSGWREIVAKVGWSKVAEILLCGPQAFILLCGGWQSIAEIKGMHEELSCDGTRAHFDSCINRGIPAKRMLLNIETLGGYEAMTDSFLLNGDKSTTMKGLVGGVEGLARAAGGMKELWKKMVNPGEPSQSPHDWFSPHDDIFTRLFRDSDHFGEWFEGVVALSGQDFTSKLDLRLANCLEKPNFYRSVEVMLGKVCGMDELPLGHFVWYLAGMNVPKGKALSSTVVDRLNEFCSGSAVSLPRDSLVHRGWRSGERVHWFQFCTTSVDYSERFGQNQEHFVMKGTRDLRGLSLAQNDMAFFSNLMMSCSTCFLGTTKERKKAAIFDAGALLQKSLGEETYRRTDPFNIGALFAYFLRNFPGTPTAISGPLNTFDYIHDEDNLNPQRSREIALLVDPNSCLQSSNRFGQNTDALNILFNQLSFD